MSSKKIIAIGVAVVLLLLTLGIVPPGVSIFTSVPSGHTGILTTYGKVEEDELAPGLYWKKPWQKLVVMDNRVQRMNISSGIKNATTSDTAETKDQQLIPAFDFEIQYQLIEEMTNTIYSNYGINYTDKLITSNALQAIKETFALYNAEEIVSAKAAIPEKICEKLNSITEPLGVKITKINFVTYDFSPEYTAILEQRALLNAQLENNQLQQKNDTIAAQTQYDVAVKQAQKDAETQRIAAENANAISIANANAKAETDKINAENEAYVTRTKAQAEKDARLAAAEAEKAELEAKSAGLNDYVIQQEFIEKWNGELVPSIGDAGFGFTDYTSIMESFFLENTFSTEEVID